MRCGRSTSVQVDEVPAVGAGAAVRGDVPGPRPPASLTKRSLSMQRSAWDARLSTATGDTEPRRPRCGGPLRGTDAARCGGRVTRGRFLRDGVDTRAARST